jgi:hypothetical protein
MASDAGSAELSDESASAADERAYEWWKSIKQDCRIDRPYAVSPGVMVVKRAPKS